MHFSTLKAVLRLFLVLPSLASCVQQGSRQHDFSFGLYDRQAGPVVYTFNRKDRCNAGEDDPFVVYKCNLTEPSTIASVNRRVRQATSSQTRIEALKSTCLDAAGEPAWTLVTTFKQSDLSSFLEKKHGTRLASLTQWQRAKVERLKRSLKELAASTQVSMEYQSIIEQSLQDMYDAVEDSSFRERLAQLRKNSKNQDMVAATEERATQLSFGPIAWTSSRSEFSIKERALWQEEAAIRNLSAMLTQIKKAQENAAFITAGGNIDEPGGFADLKAQLEEDVQKLIEQEEIISACLAEIETTQSSGLMAVISSSYFGQLRDSDLSADFAAAAGACPEITEKELTYWHLMHQARSVDFFLYGLIPDWRRPAYTASPLALPKQDPSEAFWRRSDIAALEEKQLQLDSYLQANNYWAYFKSFIFSSTDSSLGIPACAREGL